MDYELTPEQVFTVQQALRFALDMDGRYFAFAPEGGETRGTPDYTRGNHRADDERAGIAWVLLNEVFFP
jgi:hypothetical protein